MFKVLVSLLLLGSLALANCESTIKEEKTALSAGPVCELCTVVLTAAQSLLEQNKTEDEVIKFIERQLCGKLGSLNATCVNYMESNGRQILYELSQKVDPSIVCHHIGLCAFKPAPASNLKPLVEPNSLNCTVCKLVFEQVQNLLQSNASEAQIIALIEKDLCNATGKMNPLCKTVIDTYGPTILTYLAKGVDPEKVCELIGMCTKNSTIDLAKKLKQTINENPLYCTVCEYAVQFLDVELKNNKSEQAIVAALDKVCKIAPASSRQQCEALINSYGIYLVELLINFADPLKVCQAIKLC